MEKEVRFLLTQMIYLNRSLGRISLMLEKIANEEPVTIKQVEEVDGFYNDAFGDLRELNDTGDYEY